jgi:hypothetical protein
VIVEATDVTAEGEKNRGQDGAEILEQILEHRNGR